MARAPVARISFCHVYRIIGIEFRDSDGATGLGKRLRKPATDALASASDHRHSPT